MESNIIPVITTVIGGVLTLLGGLTLNHITEKRNKRTLLIEKLEEAYLLVDSLGDWIGNMQSKIIGQGEEKDIPDSMTKIVLFLKAYLGYNEKMINTFKKSHSELWQVIFDYPRNNIEKEEYISRFVKKRDALMDQQGKILDEIAIKIASLLN